MTLEGIPTNNYARNRQSSELTDYAKACVAQLQTLCKYFIDSMSSKNLFRQTLRYTNSLKTLKNQPFFFVVSLDIRQYACDFTP